MDKNSRIKPTETVTMQNHPDAENKGLTYLIIGRQLHSMKETGNSDSRLIFNGQLADLEQQR